MAYPVADQLLSMKNCLENRKLAMKISLNLTFLALKYIKRKEKYNKQTGLNFLTG